MRENPSSIHVNSAVGGAPSWSFPGPADPETAIFFVGATYYINVSYTSDKAIDTNTKIKFKSSSFSYCSVTPVGDTSVDKTKNTASAVFLLYGLQGTDKTVELLFTTDPSAGADGTMHIKLLEVTPALWIKTSLSFENTFVKDIDAQKMLHSTLDINVISNGAPIPYACFSISTNSSEKNITIHDYGKSGDEGKYSLSPDNTYHVMADKNGQIKLDFYPAKGFTGVIRPECHFGRHSKYGENAVLFITSSPEIKYAEPKLLPMDGDNLVPPVALDQKFTVIVDPKLENISGDKIIIIADHYDDSMLHSSTLLLCEQDFIEGDKPDIIEIPYSLITEAGSYELSYMISEESGNISASNDVFFTLTKTSPNKPDPSKPRPLKCPGVMDSNGIYIPNSSSVYVNKNSIDYDGLKLYFYPNINLTPIGTVIKAVVYLNGFVNQVWASSQYIEVFTDASGKYVDSHTVVKADLDNGYVVGKIPYLKLTGWDSEGYNPGNIYVEYFISDKSKYSQIWEALLDTVEPGG